MRLTAIVILISVFMIEPAAAQTDWHVDQGFGGIGNGSSTAPFQVIQDALDAAADGDRVLVAPGVYHEPLGWTGKALTLKSTQGRAVTSIASTPQVTTTLTFGLGPSGYQRIEGFSFTQGAGSHVFMQLYDPLGAFVDCSFDGVDLLVIGLIPHFSFEGCEITNSEMTQYGPGTNTGWGWFRLIDCHVHDIEEIDFIYGTYLPAFMLQVGVIEIRNSRFDEVANLFGNSFVQLLDVQGSAFSSVGHILGYLGQLSVAHSSFHDAPIQAPMISTIDHSILWSSGTASPINGQPALSHCDVKGGWTGLGHDNVDVDPQFADAANGDLHLQATSPLIDAGQAILTQYISPVDFDGDDRVTGRFIDIGADEFDSGPFPLAGSGDNFSMLVWRAGVRVNGVGIGVSPGDGIEVLIDYQHGVLPGAPVWLYGTLFSTGASPTSPAGHPFVHLDPFSTDLLHDTTLTGSSYIGLPSGGLLLNGVVPAGFAGMTYRLQAFSLSPQALNGWYAATDAADLLHM